MSFWKNPKCPICRKKLKKGQPLHELRLGDASDDEDIPHVLEVCGKCARFFDFSAEAILNNARKHHVDPREKPSDQDNAA